jgi:large conductance mechanosensitive channel
VIDMIKGFKEFIARGNVIDLAVAVVIGAAFGAVVTSIVNALVNPLIGALLGGVDLTQALIVPIPTVTGGTALISFGAILNALIQFLAIAIVVYFAFVYPMNKWRQRAAKREALTEEVTPAPTETELLAEIRDLLAKQSER